jgi:hypothetical protein
MKKNVLNLAIASLFTLVAGTANALVVDTFDQNANNQTATSTGGNWASLLYTGNGVYNNANRLLLARDAHSHTIVGGTTNLLVDAATDSFTSSNGSGLDTRVYYGTGIKNFVTTNGTSDNAPNIGNGLQSTQLNISSLLTDTFYFDVASAFAQSMVTISFYDTNGAVLGSTQTQTYSAGRNSFLLSAFTGLTAQEATDIDGIGIFFAGNGAGNNFGAATGLSEVGITAAVPEPETYAMLMAGLGLMGLVSRRRKA